MSKRVLCALASLVLALPPAWASRTLDIDTALQETPAWCWATVQEMVFRYYGLPALNGAGDYQCSIIGLVHPVCFNNCYACSGVGAQAANPAQPTLENLRTSMVKYSAMAAKLTSWSGTVSGVSAYRALSFAELVKEVDDGRPVMAAISPSGFSLSGVPSHVALIIGYEDEGKQVILNDPFPYPAQAFLGQIDPFSKAGGSELQLARYQIPYQALITKLKWTQSIFHIRCTGSGCITGANVQPAPPEGEVENLDTGDWFRRVVSQAGSKFSSLRGKVIEGGETWRGLAKLNDAEYCHAEQEEYKCWVRIPPSDWKERRSEYSETLHELFPGWTFDDAIEHRLRASKGKCGPSITIARSGSSKAGMWEMRLEVRASQQCI